MQSSTSLWQNTQTTTKWNSMPPKDLLTLAQAARRIGCTKRALQLGCKRGELPYVWDEAKYRILVNLADAQNWWLRPKKHAGVSKKNKSANVE